MLQKNSNIESKTEAKGGGARVAELTEENSKLKEENERLRRENESLRSKIKRLEGGNRKEAKAESSEMKRKVDELESLLVYVKGNISREEEVSKKSGILPTSVIVDKESEAFDYIDEGRIGEGCTSITYKVIDRRTNTPLCKKVIKHREDQDTAKDGQQSLKEFELLYFTDHPCIGKSKAIDLQEELEQMKEGKPQKVLTIALYLEYEEIPLSKLLKAGINNTLKARIVVDVAHALKYIHSVGLMHRDVKVENIMLNSVFETKLVDFGHARITESVLEGFSYVEDSLTKGVGTLTYMSPEMANEEEYDNKTDVYSFGVVLHFIFANSLPIQNLRDKLNKKEIRIENAPSVMSSFCVELIKKCMAPLPENRPSFAEILSDLRNHNFDLAPSIDPSILIRRDKELEIIENYKFD